jgi:transposase-like protein
MSLIEEARTVRQRIVARLRELEPLVREYEELRQAAAELGIDEATAAPASSARPSGTARRTQGRARSRSSPARAAPVSAAEPADELGERVLDAVRSAPGQTVAEYARALGVAPTALYRPVRELTTAGTIVKRARQLYPS